MSNLWNFKNYGLHSSLLILNIYSTKYYSYCLNYKHKITFFTFIYNISWCRYLNIHINFTVVTFLLRLKTNFMKYCTSYSLNSNNNFFLLLCTFSLLINTNIRCLKNKIHPVYTIFNSDYQLIDSFYLFV